MPAKAEEEGCGSGERRRMIDVMTAGNRRMRHIRPEI
jgi:hypothetical protein